MAVEDKRDRGKFEPGGGRISFSMEGRAGSGGWECPGHEAIRSRVIEQLARLGWGGPRISVDRVFRVDVGGEPLEVTVDLLVLDGGRPFLLVECVAGHLAVRERAAVAKARLLPGGPVPFVLIANETDAVVVEVGRGREIGFGMEALPTVLEKRPDAWRNLQKPSREGIERERRVLAAYGNLGCSGGGRDLS